MLADKDRIFTNIYGIHDVSLKGAMARGQWDNTKALIELGHEEIIERVKASGLRGRGRAGFNTAMKWRFCRDARADERYIVCNADEGEPGTFKDRVLLNLYADSLFEGIDHLLLIPA